MALTAGHFGRRHEVPGRGQRAVGLWLAMLAAMVGLMVLLGGATRLTGSGLSIVEWRPIAGVLPPLDGADWQQAFGAYRATPEYTQVNRGMSLADFKQIFWLEYLHRLFGRLLGLAFLLPFLWFLWRGWIGRRMALPLAGIFLLGGLQGAVGWWMVASGLVKEPAVSHYRLALHLGLAVAIFGVLLAWSFRLLDPGRAGLASAGLRRGAIALTLLIYAQILLGALVAGLDAGLGYTSFPDMGGWFLPPEARELSPAWLNHLDNPAMVQFQHRLGGHLLLLAVAALWCAGRRSAAGAGLRRPLDLLALAALLQFALGVWVLLAGVPAWLGVAHQAGALALLTVALWTAHRAGPRAAAKETK